MAYAGVRETKTTKTAELKNESKNPNQYFKQKKTNKTQPKSQNMQCPHFNIQRHAYVKEEEHSDSETPLAEQGQYACYGIIVTPQAVIFKNKRCVVHIYYYIMIS